MTAWLLVLFQLFFVTWAQRVAPGVPPQHYDQQQYQQIPQQHIPQQQFQQPPVQQQFQQPPVQQQYQQVPVQHQPQQFQQQPQQFQQVPVTHQGQPHHPHGQPQQILNAANIIHEKEHIAEHLDVPSLDTSKMSDQELQFHYFKMHDADNNNKLDGCELIKSLIHWHVENEGKTETEEGNKVQSDESLESMIDPILKEMDANNDGYVDYAEFKKVEG